MTQTNCLMSLLEDIVLVGAYQRKNQSLSEACECHFTLIAVFMSPESAVTQPWRGIFTTPKYKTNLTLVAVDEAHCIFEW